jgi:hypothetical protein
MFRRRRWNPSDRNAAFNATSYAVPAGSGAFAPEDHPAASPPKLFNPPHTPFV